ncbi:MAG: hypothetical protein COC22_01615 [Flavobacteriaceae bacterium]|nr:MAG: hypothetical protein COC22_01615 [Flavobacteriaceae bacterium]
MHKELGGEILGMNSKFNRNYRILWNEAHQQWVVADELSSAKSKPQARSAIGNVICAMLVAGGMLASAPEDALALTGTGGLAAICTGTAASIAASATGTCTASLTDSITLANTGVINGVGAGFFPPAALTVDRLATGVSIDNSGAIHAGNNRRAIEVNVNATGTNITNQAGATIDVTGSAFSTLSAIQIAGSFPQAPFSGIMSNSGTINANASRSISSSVLAYGISAWNVDLTGSLNNTGTISATATLNGSTSSISVAAYGVALGDISGTLANSGSITGTAINHALNTSSRASVTAYGVRYSALSGTLTNDGSITATASNTGNITTNSSMSVRAYGLASFSSVTAAGKIVNNGTISATVDNTGRNFSSSMDLRAWGVRQINFAGNLTNSNTGVISATATNNGVGTSETVFARGLEINNLTGAVSNDGSITASVANAGSSTWRVNAYGINISSFGAGNVGGIVTNAGSILAKGSGTGLGSVSFVGINVANMTGLTINNSGSITATPIAGGSKAYAIRSQAGTSGIINNLPGGVLKGSITLAGTAENLNNAGLIDAPDNGVFNTVSGNYTQQAGGIMRMGASSSLSYAKLSVTGIADLTASNNIDVNVSAVNTLAAGNVLTNVLSVGLGGTLLPGVALPTVTDNSAAFDFTAAVNLAGTGIDLTVITATGADVGLPAITRTGPAVVNAALGGTYTDQGATANDAVDGNITGSIITTNTVNTAALGTYTVVYKVSDAAGNAAATVSRTVHVIVDTTPPVITLNGSAAVSIPQNSVYADAGATALDNVDGIISGSIATGGTFVNTATQGSFTITYDVSDSAGNAATQVVRTVVVTAAAPIVATATGGGGGGGCTINPNASFGTGTLLMFLAAGLAFFRRRKEDG